MAQNGPKWSQNRVWAPLGPSGPTNFDFPPHFTPTTGVPGPLGAIAPHPNGQKGSKKAQGPKMAQNGQKWPQNRVWAPLGPSGPTNFDSPHHFTPTTGGPDPLGVVAPHPNGQKGSKKAQKGQKWLKMAQNGPKIGSRRHLGPRNPPILTPHPILPQLQGFWTHLEPLSPPKWPKRVKKGPKGPKMAQNGQKWPKRDPPILTPRPILHQL